MPIPLARRAALGAAALAPMALRAAAQTAPTAPTAPTVLSYASDHKDVDQVATHIILGPEGAVVVDGQRLLPEGERVARLLRDAGVRVAGILITHPHTDHYGGLPAIAAAAGPGVPIVAAERTVRSMRDDSKGFNAARRRAHAERFPTQDDINAALPNRLIADGETFTLGGLRFAAWDMGPGESETTTAFHLPDHGLLFPGDLVGNMAIPAPFESLTRWLEQLEMAAQRYRDVTAVYHGHGAPLAGPTALQDLLAQRRDYLVALRDAVVAGLAESGAGQLRDDVRDRIVTGLEIRFPFHAPGGGGTRQQMLRAVVGWVATQQAQGASPASRFQ